jgi:hypothetical protein
MGRDLVIEFVAQDYHVLEVFPAAGLPLLHRQTGRTASLFGDFGVTAQLGSAEYSRPRRFRVMLRQWLSTIRLVWPECPAKISPGGRYLSVARAKAIQQRTESASRSHGGAHVYA